jgi:hypothetical protein
LLSLLTLQQDYIRAYRRYADTVAVLSAVYHVLQETPLIVDYIAIEKKLKTVNAKDVTPDLVALYESRTKGLMFEFKWSLPFSEALLEKEVKDLKKYFVECLDWRNTSGRVTYHDVVLVCHVEDAQRTVSLLSKVANEQGYDFLAQIGFAIWAWTISATREGERGEHLVLTNVHGNTRNATIEKMTTQLPGLILPEGSLTYLRSSFNFTREKPPIQYTIITLIQHVFSQFKDPRRGPAVYELTTDMIYEKAKILFPSWHEFDVETLQLKRHWISEALDALYSLQIIGKPLGKPDAWLIPIPTFRTRRAIESSLCTKLARYQLKVSKSNFRKGRPRARTVRPVAGPKMKKLSDYF